MAPRQLTSPFTKAGLGAFFRARDAQVLGFSRGDIAKAASAGQLERFGPGLYRIVSVEATEQETLAMVSAVVPAGIVCLVSALHVHDIGTQLPHQVWLAIDRKARKPAQLPTRVRFVRFSGATLTYGVTEMKMLGTNVRITSPARTVVDCFRYRNKIGLDVALEALRDVIRSRKASLDEISRAAEACRADTVMRPYIEALVS